MRVALYCGGGGEPEGLVGAGVAVVRAPLPVLMLLLGFRFLWCGLLDDRVVEEPEFAPEEVTEWELEPLGTDGGVG